ncbi:MAG: hypothetical protein U0T07_09495 [Chitinophagales bacterium]
MRKTILVFLFLSFIYLKSFAQDWSDWLTIYNSNDLKVEISFKIFYCDNSNIQSKFRYKIGGSLFSDSKYLIWKMDYLNCDNELITLQNSINVDKDGDVGIVESMDDRFVCHSLKKKFYDVKISSSPEFDKKIVAVLSSKEPESIIGKTTILKGESTTLEVKGGVLGMEAQWVWFKNDCSLQPIGSGNSITVSPNETTTYFVKAVSKTNETSCIQTTVLINQNWSDWMTIYNSNGVKVELAYNIYNCESTQKQSKFKYNITGALASTSKYLNWKMQYLNCDNYSVIQQNSLNIGKDADDGIIESMDNIFTSKSMVKEYYDVEVSNITK